MRFLFIFIISICVFSSLSQTREVDSLLKLAQARSSDSVKVNLLNDAAWKLSPYAGSNPLGIRLTYSAETLASEIGFARGKAQAIHVRAFNYRQKGNYDSSLILNLQALEIRKKTGDVRGMAKSYNNLGLTYNEDKNDHVKALEYFLNALRCYRQLNDSNWIANVNFNLGLLYNRQKNATLSLHCFEEALKIRRIKKEKHAMVDILNGIGGVYRDIDMDKAIAYYRQALEIAEELNNEGLIALLCINIGDIYLEKREYGPATKFLLKSVEVREKLDNKAPVLNSYLKLGELFVATRNFAEAEKYIKKAGDLCVKLGIPEKRASWYKLCSDYYAGKRNFESSLEYHRKYNLLHDSIYTISNTKQLAEMQGRFDAENREREIRLQKSLVSEKESELSRQTSQKYAFIGGFSLTLVLALVSYRSYRNKKRASKIIEEQKRIVEEKNKDMIDSINYARRIQSALLKEEEHISEHLPEHFILFRPKDIVSGDFYWALEKKDHLYIAVADCTGHGVPGAFMSMLGIAFLNEITSGEQLMQPARILNELRGKILKEFGETGKQKDGMDISLVSLDLNSL